MVADLGHDQAAHDQGEPNTVEQQQLTPKQMQIAALQQATAMVEAEIDSHKKELARLSPGVDVPRPRGTPQPRRPNTSNKGPNAGTSSSSRPRAASVGRMRDGPSSPPRSTPRPRAPTTATRPSPVPMPDLGGDALGGTIARSIASALAKEKTGSFIGQAAAKLMATKLEVSQRASFRAAIKNKSALVDPRVLILMSLSYETRGEFLIQLRELELESVDRRLAATIYECLEEKEKAPYVALLTDATDEDEQLAVSGRLLLDWIDNETKEAIQDDPETLKTIFDATDFFVAGASVAENKVSGSKLLKEIDALPPKYTTGVYDKAELVLTKIPGHLQDKHWVQNMHYELRKAKRARAKAPSLTDMCGDITDELKKAEPSPSANTASRAEDKAKSPKVDNGARAKRMAGQMLTGTIDKWMGPDSSFSFIAFDGDGGERVFVHKSAIKGDKPAKGDKVRFKIIAETRKGVLRECAANVSLAKDKLVANAAAVQTEEDGGDVDYGAYGSDDDGNIPPPHYRAIVT